MLTDEALTDPEYLDVITAVAHRRSRSHPFDQTWEAADLQWWWPRHPHDDPADARVWRDADGPAAAVVITRWTPERYGCDVFADADFAPAWAFAAERCAQLDGTRVEASFPDADRAAHRAARRIGFVPTPDVYGVSWLDPSGRRAPARPLPDGYRIVSRAEHASGPHPMAGRNGAGVEAGLQRCSLYDPAHDLAVLAPDGGVAGYALFWPDLITGVGLVEPVRVEQEHHGRGLAAHLLDTGLRGLAERGCVRLKVSFEPGNAASAQLYAGAGFQVTRLDRTWVHDAGAVQSRDPQS